jgi:hypothetical protein
MASDKKVTSAVKMTNEYKHSITCYDATNTSIAFLSREDYFHYFLLSLLPPPNKSNLGRKFISFFMNKRLYCARPPPHTSFCSSVSSSSLCQLGSSIIIWEERRQDQK